MKEKRTIIQYLINLEKAAPIVSMFPNLPIYCYPDFVMTYLVGHHHIPTY
jgi:hypothetical protein